MNEDIYIIDWTGDDVFILIVGMEDSRIRFPNHAMLNNDRVAAYTAPDVYGDFMNRRKKMKKRMKSFKKAQSTNNYDYFS
jgi:hypothetical protein